MKHAIMIMAHKDVEQLCRLVEYFSRDCNVFIHFDKKYDLTEHDVDSLKQYPWVRQVVQTHDVYWGGTSVLDCEMSLIRMAYEKSDAGYFHLISGQDYPIRPLDSFLQFFENHKDEDKHEYLQFTHLPHPKWERNTFRRLQYYYPYDLAGDRPNPRGWVAQKVMEQQMRGTKRPLPDEFDHIYGGSQWFSISRDAVKTLLDYTDRSPSFYKRMWMTFAPEECYVATVLVNLLGEDRINNKNLRFIRWRFENGNSPANLGMEHFRYLTAGDHFFARKVELPCSAGLLDNIDRYLHFDAPITNMPNGGWDYKGYVAYGYDEKFCEAVHQLWCDIGASTGVDIGCGSGQYVAEWRYMNMSFAGYDANPYTPELSSMLLPEDDEPCGVADITEEIMVESQFDMVVCKDVLQYIPQSLVMTAVQNLARLSAHIIIVCLGTDNRHPSSTQNEVSEECLISLFDNEDFVVEKFLTARMRIDLSDKRYIIFIRKGKQIAKAT